MKHKGNRDYYHSQQERELYAAYKKCVWDNNGDCIKDVFKRIVNTPTSRFFVTEERAAIVIGSMLRGSDGGRLSPTKKEMYEEIYRRVVKLMKERPEGTLQQLLRIVLAQPAPKFYITAGSAQVLIHRIKHNRK